MAKKNTDAISFNLTGLLDLENMTITHDDVVYSLKDKLQQYDGHEVSLSCSTQIDITPLLPE